MALDKPYAVIHDAKLDALEELIEELAGQPLLVAYEFQSDLERIRERLGADTPTLSGLSGKRIAEVEAQWNRGELPVLLVHPASAGHGLNLQGAGASHICWFSRPWDLEAYDQTIRRIYRQGSTSDRVVNHILSVAGTLDEIVGAALRDKDTTQNRLLTALNAEIMRDDPAPTPVRATTEEDVMPLKKLGFKSTVGGREAAAAAEAPITIPKGWGSPPAAAQDDEPKRPKGWGPPGGEPPVDEQRESIRSKLRAAAPAKQDEDEEPEEVPASVRALEAFPADVVEKLNGDDEDDELEDAEDAAEVSWDGLSTRYANALQKAGLVSPGEAYGYGKKELIDNVEGFGEKGWEELAAMFAESNVVQTDIEDVDQQEPEKSKSAPAAPKRWALETPTVQDSAEQEKWRRDKRAERLAAESLTTGDEPTKQHIGVDYGAGEDRAFAAVPLSGSNPQTLATLFEAIASLLRGR